MWQPEPWLPQWYGLFLQVPHEHEQVLAHEQPLAATAAATSMA